MLTNTGDELGGRPLRATACQLIDPAAQASPPNRHLKKTGHAIVHGAHHVRSYRLDIPAQTQARRRQLRFVEFVEQIRKLTSLFGDSGKHKLMIDGCPSCSGSEKRDDHYCNWTIYLVHSRTR